MISGIRESLLTADHWCNSCTPSYFSGLSRLPIAGACDEKGTLKVGHDDQLRHFPLP
jgi:hypothetical protein